VSPLILRHSIDSVPVGCPGVDSFHEGLVSMHGHCYGGEEWNVFLTLKSYF